MIYFRIFPNCNLDTDDYDVIDPENSTKDITPPQVHKLKNMSLQTRNYTNSNGDVNTSQHYSNYIVRLVIIKPFLYGKSKRDYAET